MHGGELIDIANRVLAIRAGIRESEDEIGGVWVTGDLLCERMVSKRERLERFMGALQAFRTVHGIATHIHKDDRCERHAEHRRDGERCAFLGSAERRDEQRDDDRIAKESDPWTGVQPCKGSETTAVGDSLEEDTIEENRRDEKDESDRDSGGESWECIENQEHTKVEFEGDDKRCAKSEPCSPVGTHEVRKGGSAKRFEDAGEHKNDSDKSPKRI